jgi:hypothetical protein
MPNRPNPERFSETLPQFEVELFNMQDPDGSYDMLAVRCPRTGCRTRFWVQLKWRVLRPVKYADHEPPAYPYGRPCPHCSAAGAIPPEWRVYPTTTNPKPRRIVRRRRSK